MDPKIGDWVLVAQDGKDYAGKVGSVEQLTLYRPGPDLVSIVAGVYLESGGFVRLTAERLTPIDAPKYRVGQEVFLHCLVGAVWGRCTRIGARHYREGSGWSYVAEGTVTRHNESCFRLPSPTPPPPPPPLPRLPFTPTFQVGDRVQEEAPHMGRGKTLRGVVVKVELDEDGDIVYTYVPDGEVLTDHRDSGTVRTFYEYFNQESVGDDDQVPYLSGWVSRDQEGK